MSVALLGNQMASFLSLVPKQQKSIFDNQTYTEVNLNGRKAHHSASPNPDLVKTIKSVFDSIIKLHNFWLCNFNLSLTILR